MKKFSNAVPWSSSSTLVCIGIGDDLEQLLSSLLLAQAPLPVLSSLSRFSSLSRADCMAARRAAFSLAKLSIAT
jgi:hypothetical protein